MSDNRFSKATTINEVVTQAMGAASTCWKPRPAGEFDSQAASALADEALARIAEIAREGWQTLAESGLMTVEQIIRDMESGSE